MDTIEIFCSYALDEDRQLVREFKNHLSTLEYQQIKIWYSYDESPGIEWQRERDNHLNSAHIVLLLISSSFINSPECNRVVSLAMERSQRDDACVIPIVLRYVSWQDAPFGALMPLPDDRKPVLHSSRTETDAAFTNVVEGIKLVIEQIRDRKDDEQSVSVPASRPPRLFSRTTMQTIRQARFDRFMQKEYYRAVQHYKDRSDHHVKAWKQLQQTLVGLSMVVALLVGGILFTSASTDISSLTKFLLACFTFLFSFMLVIISIILMTSYSHEKWIVYRRTVDELEKEHNQYEYELGLYEKQNDRRELFMRRVLAIIDDAQQVVNPTRWRTTNNTLPSQ